MQKRILFRAGAAIGAVIALGLTGCTSTGSASDGDSFSYRIPDRFAAWLADDLWNEPLQDDAGITVDVVDGGPADSHYQQLDLMLSSGDLEDATIATMAQAQTYGAQGAFLDLAPLIREKAPHLQKYIDENPDFARLIEEEDGSIYGLITENPKLSNVTFYRQDMFDAAGITAQPRTIAEFTEALRALKKTYGADPAYHPLGGRETFLTYQYAFDAQDGIDDEGTVHGIFSSGKGSDIHSAGFEQMVDWYADLYREGLIDPQWVQGAVDEESWQTEMLNGGISVTYDYFTRPFWFLQNAAAAGTEGYDVGVLNAFQADDGRQLLQAANPRYIVDRVFVVNARTDSADAIMRFLDHLYTEEGQMTYHYGVEGTSYDIVDGEAEYTVSYAENADQELGKPVWNFAQDRLTYPAPVDDQAYYRWQDEYTASFAEDYFDAYLEEFPVLKYTEEQTKERTRLLADVAPFVDAGVIDFVTGERSLDEWSEFIREADDRGYADIVAIDQAAWDAME